MPKWNRFSEEVAIERQSVRDYGIDRIENAKPVSDSYKAQSLRELAMRLEYEYRVRELEDQIRILTDLLESKS